MSFMAVTLRYDTRTPTQISRKPLSRILLAFDPVRCRCRCCWLFPLLLRSGRQHRRLGLSHGVTFTLPDLGHRVDRRSPCCCCVRRRTRSGLIERVRNRCQRRRGGLRRRVGHVSVQEGLLGVKFLPKGDEFLYEIAQCRNLPSAWLDVFYGELCLDRSPFGNDAQTLPL